MSNSVITVSVSVKASIQHVWNCFTLPEHIVQWNHASNDWHCPAASNDVRVGGQLAATMAARDGSAAFEFKAVYKDVLPEELLMYTLEDGRNVNVNFASIGEITEVVERFEAESMNSPELQQQGWQAILDNFKSHCETTYRD